MTRLPCLPRRLLQLLLSAALLSGLGHEAAAQLVVARVNGAPITNEQLDRSYSGVLRERSLHQTRMQDPAQARELKRLALDRLIRDELFWQQASKELLLPTDAELDSAYERARAHAGSSDAFAKQLARQGMDERTYRDQIRRLMAADRYAQRVVDERVKVVDADIEAYYKTNAHLFNRPERWHVRTIAIAAPSTLSVEQRRGAQARIEGLRQRLAIGGDFDQLARQYSDDPTRPWGGALDPAPLTDLPDWMRKPVARLTPGQLSPVIESPAGYHLLKLDKLEPASAVPIDGARQAIYDHLFGRAAFEALDKAGAELRATARVELLIPL